MIFVCLRHHGNGFGGLSVRLLYSSEADTQCKVSVVQSFWTQKFGGCIEPDENLYAQNLQLLTLPFHQRGMF